MQDYLDRFNAMVDAIRHCSDKIALLSYAYFKPVSQQTIKEVESQLGLSLPSSIVDFFSLTDGLQLRWISRNNLAFDPVKCIFTPGPFDRLLPWSNYLPDNGVINILPLRDIFMRDWQGFVWFGSERGSKTFFDVQYSNLDFRKQIKPLDAFSNDYSMAFFVGDRDPQLKVLLAEDHLADFTSSKITDFNSYLEFLLATRGIVAERARFYTDEFNSSAQTKNSLTTDAGYWINQDIPDPCRE